MRRRGIVAGAVALASAVALIAAPGALATFHLIKVREVFPSSGQDGYVELQMFAAGQHLLGGHSLTVYNADGTLLHTSTFPGAVANAENQRMVLVGDTGVATTFGVAPDLTDAALSLSPAGGAACWNAGGLPADCVAWGNFSGGAALQAATGTSAGAPVSPGGVGAGKAVRRSIAPGCPTLLEESDDSNSSAADFAEVTPAPRNDAAAVTEAVCPGVPNTAIDDRPPPFSSSTTAGFTYEAPTATSYECKLDAGTFASCPNAGTEYTALAEGSHTFQVRGVNVSGPDPTPATYTWAVDTTPPTTTIDQHPADPSAGATAAFTFHASETGASFQCSLVLEGAPASFSSCTSGKTYSALADGEWVFAVRATDQAGNPQASATTFAWTVDNSLADTTPPETTLGSRPPDPSLSPVATFTYGSNEPGSAFECSLDGAPFSPCPVAGIGYAGLANGTHSFQVRAVDTAANRDPTPAAYSFTVAVPAAAPAQARPEAPDAAAPKPPQTVLAAKPAARGHDRTPTLKFHADGAGASFECAVDRSAFRPCRSPFTTKPLAPGTHTLRVRAVLGTVADPTPAKCSFRILAARQGRRA